MQLYRVASSATLEIIQKLLIQNFPLDKILRAQLGLKVSRTLNPVPITIFKGLKGFYRPVLKNILFEYILVL